MSQPRILLISSLDSVMVVIVVSHYANVLSMRSQGYKPIGRSGN